MIINMQKSRKNDAKIIAWIIIGFLFVAWLCTPPGNKFLQVCFWGNNTKLFIAKLTNKDAATEYIFHRNNAIYLAKMYPNDKKKALIEIDRAIRTIPTYAPEADLYALYKDRAYINLFLGNYRASLSDFINSKNITFNDNLTVAMLFKEVGNYKEAQKYCNEILNYDSTAYAGFACLADLYTNVGKPEVAIRIWDLAIDRRPNNPRAYADRANIKKSIGDFAGYESDLKKAKEYSPTINLTESITYDALHPKVLILSIR